MTAAVSSRSTSRLGRLNPLGGMERHRRHVIIILALVVLFYSTFFFFFFVAELLDEWLWRWAAFLIVFGIMVVVTAVLALFGYLKVRRIRGPQKTIASVKEIPGAFSPGPDTKAVATTNSDPAAQKDPSGW